MIRLFIFCTFLVPFWLSRPVAAEPVSQPHIQLELTLPDATLQAGRETLIGVRMDLEAGWHLYWKNPGDSGRAPTIQWELPAGFTAGTWEWPVPTRISFGRLVNYGYERRVLLVAPLKVPSEGWKGDIILGAHVEWLVCSEECIPGKLDLRLKVPVKETTPEPSRFAPLFQNAKEALPKPLPDRWKVQGLADSRELQLLMSGFPIVGETLFFPLEPRLIENSAPQHLGRQGDVLSLILKRSDQSPPDLKRLAGILVTGSKGYTIDVALGPRPTSMPPWILWTVGGLTALGLGIFIFLKFPRGNRSVGSRSKRMAKHLATGSLL